jgi:hypothetical protein
MNLVGSKLGKYQLIERLGQGGMAQVYRAIQPTIERPVAIKVLHSHLVTSDGFVDRFKREARSLGQLQHPHIVQVIDFDAQGDLYYMVMDFIPGKTLRTFLDGSGPVDPVRALDIVEQLAEALAFAHRRGLIHRDVKPGNVLFRDDACTDAVLTDFGIGRLVDDMTMTISGSVMGTPAYMSPEASLGLPVDARADLYSLGITLYEMVTGSVPYRGDTPLSVIRKQIDTPLPPLREQYAHLPEPLIRIIERALEKDVAHRYQRAEELVADIRVARAALAGPPAPGLPATPPPSPRIGATIPLTVTTSQRLAAPSRPAPPDAVPAAPAASPRRRAVGVLLGLFALVLVVGLTAATVLTRPAGDRANVEPTATPQATGAAGATAVAVAPAGAVPLGQVPASPAASAPPLVLPETFGALEFADRTEVATGRFLLRLSRVPQPPAGAQYRLWLQSGDEAPRDAGPLTVDAGQILQTGDLEADLIRPGSRVLVSLEPEGAELAAPGEQIVFAGELAAPVATTMRRLLVEEQGGAGRLRSAFEQARLADEHAGFAQDALAAGDLAFAKRHAEHVVNILDGADGAFFGDVNLDGRAENPGDNIGVRGHLRDSRELLAEALAAGTPTGEREAHGAVATAAIDASLALIDPAIERAQALLAAPDVVAAQAPAEALRGQTLALLGGAGEPAAVQAATSAALRLAAIPLLALSPSTPAPDAVAAVPGRVGTLSLAGSGAGRPGDLRLAIAELAPPPAGFHYDAWMVGSDGLAPIFLGELSVFNRHGSLAAGIDPAVAAGYERVVVTLQPDGGENVAPDGAEMYSGALNTGAGQLAAQLRAGDGPLLGAEGQVAIAEEHLQLARDAWTAGDLAEAQRHAEHVVNILDGADGAFFGDVNLDGRAENPGDNVGVRGHLLRVVERVRGFEEQGALATGEQQFYAEQLITSAERSLETIEATIDRVKKVSASDSLAEAARFLDETGVLLGQVRAGRDADGNGIADQLLAEGGMVGLAAFAVAFNAVDIFPAGTAVGEPLFTVAGIAGSPVAATMSSSFLCRL